MRQSLTACALFVAALGACSDEAATPTGVYPVYAIGPSSRATVSSAADAGPGSFRAAVEAANGGGSLRLQDLTIQDAGRTGSSSTCRPRRTGRWQWSFAG